MDIPYKNLSSSILQELVEEFVTREGTDYGGMEVSLDVKVAQVIEQIHRGVVVIRYDPQMQSCGLFLKA